MSAPKPMHIPKTLDDVCSLLERILALLERNEPRPVELHYKDAVPQPSQYTRDFIDGTLDRLEDNA